MIIPNYERSGYPNNLDCKSACIWHPKGAPLYSPVTYTFFMRSLTILRILITILLNPIRLSFVLFLFKFRGFYGFVISFFLNRIIWRFILLFLGKKHLQISIFPFLSSIDSVTRRYHIPIYEEISYIFTLKARRLHSLTKPLWTTEPYHWTP